MSERVAPLIQSSRGIIVHDGAVALIERVRANRHFFVFPGGSIEPHETSREALIREVAEETGLIVAPDRIVAEVTFPDRVQAFWLACVIGGTFGTGTGLEVSGGFPPELGMYQPIWVPLADLPNSKVLPAAIAAEVHAHTGAQWPPEVRRFVDDVQWWR